MALKRINKELTDLGRYVCQEPTSFLGHDPGLDLCDFILPDNLKANQFPVVILPHHAQRDPSVTTWFAHACTPQSVIRTSRAIIESGTVLFINTDISCPYSFIGKRPLWDLYVNSYHLPRSALATIKSPRRNR